VNRDLGTLALDMGWQVNRDHGALELAMDGDGK
jgi:hypothetical protein